MIYKITPVPKPRMTKRDRWVKRPATEKYWAFKDECKRQNVSIELYGSVITFYIPMPKSWSKKKKVAMAGRPHQQRPDVDNLLKGLLDAVF